MDFGDISNRFKKVAEQRPVEEEKVIDFNELHIIQGRIVGVLLQDARIAKGYDVDHVASFVNVPSETVVEWEYGHQTPSLPQLEVLAYELEIPVTHFITSTETFQQQLQTRHLDRDEYLTTRDRMIGVMLRSARAQSRFTLDYLGERTGLTPQEIETYEFGYVAVPLSHLNTLANALNINIGDFLEHSNKVGRFLQAQSDFNNFLEMDPHVREFVTKPSNQAYIDLAMKLSEMDINKLRDVAESILEITL